MQAKSAQDVAVGCGDAAGFGHDTESALIVPHGPADVILLQRHAHVVQPCGAGGRRRIVAKDAELAAVDRNVVQLRPFRGKGNGVLDAGRIPAVFAVLVEKKLAGEVRLLV